MKITQAVRSLAHASGPTADSFLSDEQPAQSRLHAALGEARRTLDVCVFALSDGRLAGVLKAAARRGVRVRVLTDDEKRLDRGSKAKELEGVPGIELRDDRNSSKLMGGGKHADSAGRTSHMHHKFAVADGGRVLCTGSFNWTTSAVLSNYEDVLVLRGAQSSAGEAYQKRFDELWAHFA